MKDTEVSSLDIYRSMEKSISEKLEKLSSKIERNKEKLNGPGKVGFVDRLTMNSENKSHEEEIRRLTELSKAMSNLKFSESNKYKLPEVVTSSLDDISSLLTAEETAELRNVVNSSLRSANKAKKDNIKNASLEVQKILGKLGLSDKAFLVYDGLDYKKSISFEVATKEMEKELLSDLTPEYTPININKSEVSLDSGESVLISKIEEMISKRELEPTKSINNIVANIAEIKEAMLTREKANRITLKISNAMTELNKITEIDITMIKTFLSKIQNKYQKELDKANKFISKFDFSNIKEQIEAKDAKENKENEKENRITTYENLAYELEKALAETPDDLQNINEIKAAMQDFARKFDIPENELDLARNNGKAKYQSEAKAQKAKVESAKAKIEYEDELRRTVMAEIREEAIRELETSKAFEDSSFEERNGDVYAEPINRETMIKRKMDELMKLAEMTPIERGLYDLKKQGRIKNDATVEDLTPQQLNDIRIGYSDNAYSFMADYKDWKARETVKPKADTIYKEYIKYRTSLKNKNEFLSFSDYAKQIHKIENMSDIMVDENLKEEMRETLQEQGGRSR
ncbi:MAG: hypothetical protein UFP41_03240 [Bacilli bacterium]|nr:hypothetical protein [Bacilli bacterium]